MPAEMTDPAATGPASDASAREDPQDARTRLQLAAALGGFGAWSIDVRTGQARWSDHLEEAGAPCSEEDIVQRYAPECHGVLRAACERCAHDGTPFEMDLETLEAGGMRKAVRVRGVAVRDAAGGIVRVQAVFREMERSERAAQEQRQLAERVRRTLDSLSDGFGSLDRAWRITYVNPMALRILRMDAQALIGRNYFDVFPEARGTVWEDSYRCAMDQGLARRFEAFHAPLGLWLRVSVFPSRNGIAASFSDITAARQQQEQLERLNEELERRVRDRTAQLQRMNEELVSFTIAVSHDLRAPLAAISGFTRALAERVGRVDDPKLAHYLSRIEAGAARMDRQLHALVELSRVGRAELRPARVDLTAIARETLDALGAAQPGRDVRCTVAERLHAEGDAGLLRTLLENLLGNAWKFSAQRHPAHIEVGQQADGAFFVRDNGAGFEAGRAAELFTPFRRLHDEQEFQGLGVGLASARRVVQRHGGHIWAVSRPGEGATFFFTLGPPAAP